jgi:hypothetical protein
MVPKLAALIASALILVLAVRAEAEPPALSQGETLYVPVYSTVLHGNLDSRGKPGQVLLSSMLSIRNTDPKATIVIKSVKYYDTDGKLIRDYQDARRNLGPFGSSDVFVEHKDTSGGNGANFVVVWESSGPVNPPLVECINAYFFGSQSVAFPSVGRPIRAAD